MFTNIFKTVNDGNEPNWIRPKWIQTDPYEEEKKIIDQGTRYDCSENNPNKENISY